ncbi:MAG: hypothetical protein V4726_22415 [Verrucomicrobiota bacterium]
MKSENPTATAAASTFSDPDDDRNADLDTSEVWQSQIARDAAPEVPPGAEELVTWDEVPAEPEAASGDQVEDEDDVALSLVTEGIEEADRELRISAADEPDDEDLSDDEEAAADYPRRGILS